ncbi:MAG: ABC transporter permease subunit [Alphaproteobacteria bacterium]|nr:ABC transporter permease subunit [Alphaproteobacteria bacterium]MBU0796005.1 ABC transporter permease subunit [Alphaproteobacteria bacterium]MBU0886859.1 ABC transporter permease subunit [Alphaproteobacteria bacterium]MBU1812398.1 ABC transporter permease subunit [Alphaproteobacteria bacterium]MBU2090317.1 ABC transporter permease subunit [Alphaproteobacteria bacterium]
MRIVTALYLIYLAAPIVMLAVGSFGESWTNTLFPTGLTTRWYEEVYNDPSFRRAFLTSLQVVLATCVIDALIGVPLAYALHAARQRGIGLAVRMVSLMPIVVPELVLAFGFILVFSSDTLPWLGSVWLLIAGHVVLTLPYLLNTLVADMAHMDIDGHERAAMSLGASFPQRFFDIVLPSLRHSLLSGLIVVATLSVGEFQLSNLVAGFLDRTYPIVLLQAFYGATGFACAATVVLLLLAALASAASGASARLGRAV